VGINPSYSVLFILLPLTFFPLYLLPNRRPFLLFKGLFLSALSVIAKKIHVTELAKLCNEEYDTHTEMVSYLYPAKVGKKGESNAA
jgi:hypothetical protein